MTVHIDRHQRRLDDGDEPPTDPSSGFASRPAKRLVLTYTGQGETDADGDGDGDQFLYCATRAEADTARSNGQLVPDGRTYQVDLPVFATSQRRRD